MDGHARGFLKRLASSQFTVLSIFSSNTHRYTRFLPQPHIGLQIHSLPLILLFVFTDVYFNPS